jgi:hypothetical protein
MANNFKNINYARQLYESLRNYYSVNTAGQITILYKFLAAMLQPLQAPFDSFVLFRNKEALIASCKWQIGQLTNVLNFLYDSVLSRIFITQNSITVIADPMFQYAPINFDSDFGTAPLEFERKFTDRASETVVTINVPAGVDLADLTATVEQIRLKGIPYQIVTI